MPKVMTERLITLLFVDLNVSDYLCLFHQQGSSNTPYIYGTAKVKLLRLAHKLDITKQLVPIVDDLGMTKGILCKHLSDVILIFT